MTESEWLECTDPTPMLEFLRGKISSRKLRLFAVGCSRRLWPLLTQSGSREAVETAERFADGLADQAEIEGACDKADAALVAVGFGGRLVDAAQAAVEASGYYLWDYHESEPGVDGGAEEAARASGRIDEKVSQTGMLRCLLGCQLFCPVCINLSWLIPTVTNLAQAAYDERIMPSGELDPARLAVLSDALEEAGCDDAAILDHLRSQGPHVRGCWAIDLLLGRS